MENRMTDEFLREEVVNDTPVAPAQPVPQPQPQPQPQNPLTKHFRAPGLSLTLPSKGYYYNNGEVETTNEIEIFPMTTADELTLKNPDALLSGRAVESLINSCVPAVRDAMNLVAPDLDVILLAIRAVTYGDDMEMSSVCPKCEQQNTFVVNVRNAIATQPQMNPPYIVKLEDNLEVYVKPYTLEDQTKAALVAFEEGKKIRQFEGASDEAIVESGVLNESFEKLKNLKYALITNSITHIISDGTTVVEKSFIAELLLNSHRKYVEAIEEKTDELNKMGIDRKEQVTCANESCRHTWETEVEFNPSNFFE